MPAVGGESGETRCQGDMEKADMVDGKKLFFLFIQPAEVFKVVSFVFLSFKNRNQRECVLDAPSRGQPQQDLWVPGAVLPL